MSHVLFLTLSGFLASHQVDDHPQGLERFNLCHPVDNQHGSLQDFQQFPFRLRSPQFLPSTKPLHRVPRRCLLSRLLKKLPA